MADSELRDATVVKTIRRIVHKYWGDTVEVPDDVISALLVLAAKIENGMEVDTANAQLLPNSEVESMTAGS